jgi:type III secretion protein D
MYELRILNGLHRGATLPLDERTQIIGQSEDADVVLVDQGIAERHAQLTLDQSGWTLEQLDGDVRGAENNLPGTQTGLAPGDFARVGAIWVTVVDESEAWTAPPAEPTDSGEPADDDGYGDGYDDKADDASHYNPADDEGPSAAELAEELAGGTVGGATADAGATDADSAKAAEAMQEAKAAIAAVGSKSRGIFSARRLMWPVGLVAVLSVAAYAMNTEDAGAEAKKRPSLASLEADIIEGRLPPTGAGNRPGAREGKDGKDGLSSVAKAGAAALTQEGLRQAFRARLAEVDLLRRFNLNLNDNSWEMQASLDEEDAARFSRILNAFMAANNIRFPVNARIGSTESLLPFRIVQVVSGANASIVTDDGSRLYIGDEYKGMRLAQIAGNRLSFTGKRNMEVKW